MTHNPAFVRLNPNDGTFHCDRHGLLSDVDAQETLRAAANVDAEMAATTKTPRLLASILDVWGKFRHPEACQ